MSLTKKCSYIVYSDLPKLEYTSLTKLSVALLQKIKTRVVGAAAYLLLALMDHFEIDVGPPSSDLERPFEP